MDWIGAVRPIRIVSLLVVALLVVGCGGAGTATLSPVASVAKVTPTHTITPTPSVLPICQGARVFNCLRVIPTADLQRRLDAYIAAGDCDGVNVISDLAPSPTTNEAERRLTLNVVEALVGCWRAAEASASATEWALIAAAPVTVKGKGNAKTKPFTLAPGDYTVTITSKSGGRDNFAATLYAVDGNDYIDLLVNEIWKAPKTYTTQEYGLNGGRYYLNMSMPSGAWIVTFTPLAS